MLRLVLNVAVVDDRSVRLLYKTELANQVPAKWWTNTYVDAAYQRLGCRPVLLEREDCYVPVGSSHVVLKETRQESLQGVQQMRERRQRQL